MIRRNFLASAVDATPAPLAEPSLAQSGGPVHPLHRRTALFKSATGIFLTHLPYRRAAADAVRWKKVADFARIRLD